MRDIRPAERQRQRSKKIKHDFRLWLWASNNPSPWSRKVQNMFVGFNLWQIRNNNQLYNQQHPYLPTTSHSLGWTGKSFSEQNPVENELCWWTRSSSYRKLYTEEWRKYYHSLLDHTAYWQIQGSSLRGIDKTNRMFTHKCSLERKVFSNNPSRLNSSIKRIKEL